MAESLRHDAFTALEELRFADNPGITDMGVVILVEALQTTTQTSLSTLDLSKVGMSNTGIAALANLVYHGRMEQLTTLSLGGNHSGNHQ